MLKFDGSLAPPILDGLRRSFREGHARAGMPDMTLRLAGRSLRIRFAGHTTPSLLRARRHLQIPEVPSPDVTLCLLDRLASGVDLPKAALPQEWWPFTRRGDVLGLRHEDIQTAYNWEARALSCWCESEKLGFYWTPDATILPGYEFTGPIRTLLHWSMGRFGCQLMHAAALGNRGGGVLLAGKGGSGKSTTALACLAAGVGFAADDYCLLEEDGLFVSSLYATAKLKWDNLERVPSARVALEEGPRDPRGKAIFYPYEHWPERIVKRIRVRAVLLPRVGRGVTSCCRPVSSREGLRALALSTMSQLPGAGEPNLRRMQKLLAQVPCFELELGSDMDQVVGTLQEFLR